MQTLLPDERWTQVEAVFQEAADLPPDSREAFLLQRCGDDSPLREEVLSLLRYDTGEKDPLLDALQASAASVVVEEPTAGRMLGPYRIEREIGRGGMSVVYLAVRADGEYRKRVAIKLIKRGMDTRSVVERLRRERRILASLEHPWIARLLDGGTTADGVPWIAMEYVEGLPIHRYCEEHKTGIADICRLIDKVCDAVACAHRNLVVHRDLKPTNILVARDGNPKLLDFGIARVLADTEALAPDSTEGPITLGHARPLTPEYASPEQLRGAAAGTPADVYSLGVVLFELLAGRRPSADETRVSVAARETGKDPRWSRKLEGDLDNILRMALREEPERRYSTVERLQADLRRYLEGRPVSARPENLRYRFGKFVRRHPAGSAIAVAGVATALLFVRVEAEAQIQKAKSDQRLGELIALANTSLYDVQGTIENLPGATQARLEIARKATESLDRLSTESGGDPRVLVALASAYSRVAGIQGNPHGPNLGDQRDAETNYAKAEKILASLTARDSSTELLLQQAELCLEFGLLLADTSRKDQALTKYSAALSYAKLALSRDPKRPEARKLVMRTNLAISDVNRFQDPSGTRRILLELLPSMEALSRDYPQDTEILLDLAALWDQVGETFNFDGSLPDVIDAYRKSAAIRERLFALRPADVQVQHDLMEAYGHLGDITGGPAVINMGDYPAAIEWFRKAAAIAQQMSKADPSNMRAQSDVGTALARIGVSQEAAGDHRGAIESFRAAEPLLNVALSVSRERALLGQTLAFMDDYKADALVALGEEDAAVQTLRQALELARRGTEKDPLNLSWNHIAWKAQAQLAVVLASRGDHAEALALAGHVLESARRPIPNDRATQAYLARALSANGAVHATLARRAVGEERITEWRAARSFYRNALVQWQANPNSMKEPQLSAMRRTEAGLAETEKALRTQAK